MKIGALKEISTGEQRVALTPESAIQLQKLGYECVVQKGAGSAAGFSDAQYKAAGVEVAATAAALTKACDVIVKVRPPTEAEIKRLSPEKTLISFFYPGANERSHGAGQIQRRQRHCHGYGAADQPRPENGRAVLDGQYCWVPSGD